MEKPGIQKENDVAEIMQEVMQVTGRTIWLLFQCPFCYTRMSVLESWNQVKSEENGTEDHFMRMMAWLKMTLCLNLRSCVCLGKCPGPQFSHLWHGDNVYLTKPLWYPNEIVPNTLPTTDKVEYILGFYPANSRLMMSAISLQEPLQPNDLLFSWFPSVIDQLWSPWLPRTVYGELTSIAHSPPFGTEATLSKYLSFLHTAWECAGRPSKLEVPSKGWQHFLKAPCGVNNQVSTE